jgi:hypothetical protein
MSAVALICLLLLLALPGDAAAQLGSWFGLGSGRTRSLELPEVAPPRRPDRYEKCGPERMYLQAEIETTLKRARGASRDCVNCSSPTLQSQDPLGMDLDAMTFLNSKGLPPTCVWSSMLWMGTDPTRSRDWPRRGMLYFHCESPSSNPAFKPPGCNSEDCYYRKPCVTEESVRLNYETLTRVSFCLGLSPYELFPIFRIESNFQTNVGTFSREGRTIVPGADQGLAELTPIAIREVNQSRLLKQLRENPACFPFHAVLSRDLSPDKPCERMAIPDNPAKSMLYGGAYYLRIRQVAETLVRSLQEQRSKAGLPELPAKEERSTIVRLTRYMYNGGPGQVAVTFRAFLQEEKPFRMNAQQLGASFSRYLEQNFGTGMYEGKRLAQKRKGVAAYPEAVTSFARRIKDRWNVNCDER